MSTNACLTLGPVLLNWPAEAWRDFYFEVADEMPVDKVFLGEVVCSKRAPLFDPHLEAVVSRLEAAGKQVIFSTLAEVTSRIDRKLVKRMVDWPQVEANDVSALSFLAGRDHAIGPYMNVYNEDSLEFFVAHGARSVCLPPEIPASGIAALGAKAAELDVALEVQVYGRVPLALSARCYHARAHGRTKDSCQFICDEDPDGMVLRTLDDVPFLTINGIQTQSYTCLNLAGELEDLQKFGVKRFRISPQSVGTRAVVENFHAVLDQQMTPRDAIAGLGDNGLEAPFANGFFYGEPGYRWFER
ncbi:MAG: ubiquinone anaerobic biosynthesis protein UbiV [Alphaproteobacteria bacterium]